MAIFVDDSTKVVVQGITGRDGSFHTTQMMEYGTNVVAGVTPGKGGSDVDGIPVFDTVADAVEKTGAVLMMATPIIIGLTRMPVAGLLMLLGGLLTLGSSVVIHLLTLPTEFDASFGRALPLMRRQDVLYEVDEPHARRLLRAAAMTYVAASLMSLLNVARWIAILRR